MSSGQASGETSEEGGSCVSGLPPPSKRRRTTALVPPQHDRDVQEAGNPSTEDPRILSNQVPGYHSWEGVPDAWSSQWEWYLFMQRLFVAGVIPEAPLRPVPEVVDLTEVESVRAERVREEPRGLFYDSAEEQVPVPDSSSEYEPESEAEEEELRVDDGVDII